ncbi:MAG TPA: hypothetical protein VN253_16600 [Kofleriaceae bacterium]|nr:hypothetical protein [Kofleriaceae bacterium]
MQRQTGAVRGAVDPVIAVYIDSMNQGIVALASSPSTIQIQ